MINNTPPLTPVIVAIVLAGMTIPASTMADDCGAPATAIHQVQGSGDRSHLAGEQVTVEGILTLDSRHKGGFRGFYLQQADGDTDNNPLTSEALFIHTGHRAGQPGHRIRVRGRVKEFHSLTELTDVDYLQDCGPSRLPEPVSVELPWPDGPSSPEALENMRVRILQPLTVIDSYHLARYGELTLAAAPQPVPTEILPPGPEAYRLEQQQQQQRLVLDDNHGVRHPVPVPWPAPALSMANTVRTGDTVSGLEGVLDFRFGAWRLQPAVTPEFHSTHPRPTVPSRDPDLTLRVITLNLENYFNGDGRGGDFPTARGAATVAQFQRQTRRLVAALSAPDPDVIAVAEVENDGDGEHSAVASLARALGPEWRHVRGGESAGNDAIRTALLYRRDRVATVGAPSRLTSSVFARQGRPPLAQILRPLDRPQGVRIIVPHLKSKACRGAIGPDRDQQDGQGCFSHSRERAARALVDWARSFSDTSTVAGTLITGDLNSYAREAPVDVLREAGFRSLIHRFYPCSADHCPQTTFRYKGRKGSLDYALASDTLVPRVVHAQAWAINAEEPAALDYRQRTTASEPWRASDHNPLIIDFAL